MTPSSRTSRENALLVRALGGSKLASRLWRALRVDEVGFRGSGASAGAALGSVAGRVRRERRCKLAGNDAEGGSRARWASRSSRGAGAGATWLVLLALLCFSTGCIRFHNDAPDAGAATGAEDDADVADGESDANLDGGEAAAPLPPLCKGRDPSIADNVAEDTLADLQRDCRIGAYFNKLPGIRLEHFKQCFAAQLGSVLGCVRGDGSKVKYPAFDTQREPELCRDMKSAHAALTTSDGDYDTFMAIFVAALTKSKFDKDEIARITKAYGSTKNDIVRLKDAGPTRGACDAGATPGN